MSTGHVSKKVDSKGRRRWFPVLELPRGEDGRRRQRWLTGHDTKKAPEQALREVLGAADKGVHVVPSKETTGAFLTDWLATIRTTVRPTTLASYESMILGHVVPRLGHIPLRELGPGHLNRLYGDLLTEGRKSKSGGGLSPRTVRYVHVIVHRALKDATRWGKLVRNPAEFADPPRYERADRSVWSAGQLRDFLGRVEASSERLAAAFHLAATTGMRRGEILGLGWSAVDLEGGRIQVVRTLVDVLYVPTFSEPKTARSRRSIALDPATVARLRRHRTAQVEERLAWGAAYRDDLDLVFAMQDGSPVNPQSFSATFDRHVRASDLPKCRLHDLRHAYASAALSSGVHLKVVSDRLGHSSISVTSDIYSHVMPQVEQDAANTVASLILGP